MLKRFVAVCLVLALAVPALGAGGKPKDPGKKANQGALIDASSLRTGVFRGRLVNPPGFDGDFVVEIAVPRLEPKKGAKAGKNRAPARAGRKAKPQPANAANSYSIKTTEYQIEFHSAPDVKVRLLEPPQVFTDKGDIKKFTPAELMELKGKNPNLPGYEASLADLKSNQIVQVSQARSQAPAKQADPNAEVAKAHKNVVAMIVVMGVVPAKDDAVKRAKKK